MPAKDDEVTRGGHVTSQDLGDQQPELAVADDSHTVSLADDSLLYNSARGGEGLDEGGVLAGDGVGDEVEVGGWYREVLRIRAVLVQNPKYCAVAAVVACSDATKRACTTAGLLSAWEVDVSDDAFAKKGLLAWRHTLAHAHKLVAEHTAETHVTLENLQVGVAHSGDEHFDEGFPG